jgi:hypothetical protein
MDYSRLCDAGRPCLGRMAFRRQPYSTGSSGGIFATVSESAVSGLVSGLVLGLGLESGILGLGLGRTKAIVLVLASSRFPLTILLASLETTGVESAGGIRSNEIGRAGNSFWIVRIEPVRTLVATQPMAMAATIPTAVPNHGTTGPESVIESKVKPRTRSTVTPEVKPGTTANRPRIFRSRAAWVMDLRTEGAVSATSGSSGGVCTGVLEQVVDRPTLLWAPWHIDRDKPIHARSLDLAKYLLDRRQPRFHLRKVRL